MAEDQAQPAYEVLDTIGEYRIVRSRLSGRLYVSWYDNVARQTRRATLKTAKPSTAVERIQNAVDQGATGDPRPFLRSKILATVDHLLDWHLGYVIGLPSGPTELIHIRKLRAYFGSRRVMSLKLTDFEAFRDDMKAQGLKVTYASRVLTTLRSAVNRAVKDDRLLKPIKVPEFATKRIKKAAPLKGPVLTAKEWAAVLDEIDSPHQLIIAVLLLNTGARITALLELTVGQIDFDQNTLELNVPGADPTHKRRPTLPITDTLRPWLRLPTNGHLVHYHGKPIAEADTAFDAAVDRARRKGLVGPKANSYSGRHSLGRVFRRARIDTEEIGVWLANGQAPDSTTLIYAPWSAEFLINCRLATEDFVREINTHTKRWDLLRPYETKPGWGA